MWQMTSTFLSSKLKNRKMGTFTTGEYSVPLAVIISTLLLDFKGSHPIARAASLGIVVILAPVSMTILRGMVLSLPVRVTSTIMTPESISSGCLDMSEDDGHIFTQAMLAIVNKQGAFAFDGNHFLVDNIPLGVVGNQSTFNAGIC